MLIQRDKLYILTLALYESDATLDPVTRNGKELRLEWIIGARIILPDKATPFLPEDEPRVAKGLKRGAFIIVELF